MTITRRILVQMLVCSGVGLAVPTRLWAGPLDSIPLDRRSKVVLNQTVTVTAGGAHGSNLFVPQRGYFSIDFAVDGGHVLGLLLMNSSQWTQLSTGRKMTGEFLIRTMIEGTASATQQIDRGNYAVGIHNDNPTPVRVTIRASFIPF